MLPDVCRYSRSGSLESLNSPSTFGVGAFIQCVCMKSGLVETSDLFLSKIVTRHRTKNPRGIQLKDTVVRYIVPVVQGARKSAEPIDSRRDCSSRAGERSPTKSRDIRRISRVVKFCRSTVKEKFARRLNAILGRLRKDMAERTAIRVSICREDLDLIRRRAEERRAAEVARQEKARRERLEAEEARKVQEWNARIRADREREAEIEAKALRERKERQRATAGPGSTWGSRGDVVVKKNVRGVSYIPSDHGEVAGRSRAGGGGSHVELVAPDWNAVIKKANKASKGASTGATSNSRSQPPAPKVCLGAAAGGGRKKTYQCEGCRSGDECLYAPW
jgi:hypothetical protein